jgi:hypothetical protein
LQNPAEIPGKEYDRTVMSSYIKLHWYIVFAGIWAIGNGLLHDIFVLRQGRPFQRELIRLLIDGHILIFSGIFYLICAGGIKEGQPLAYNFSIVTSIFLLLSGCLLPM